MIKSIRKFVDINGTVSYVETWGRWIEDEVSPEELIIFIPGNPGKMGFYEPYLQDLHNRTNIPVWSISHIGHEEPCNVYPSTKNLGCFNELWGKYDLEPQVQQKKNFIFEFTNPNTKIHLIGHSIGAWMVMQMLKDERIRLRVEKKLLVFPTIQKMADSPNGLWLNSTIRKYYHLILLIVKLFFWLPLFIRSFLVAIFLLIQSIPLEFKDAALNTAVPSIVEKVLFLAFDEMDKVTELDIQTLTLIKDNLYIIYCDHDGWAPKKYFEEIMKYDLNIDVKCVPYNHSFSLKSSSEFAFLTAKYFQENIAIN